MSKEKDMETESDSCTSDDEEKEIEQKAEELEAQLSQNVYLYDVHVELINLYRKLADLNSMRAAYERFHKNFPMTPALWLDWIHDEIKLANSVEEKNNVLSLFNKAVEDYQSVQLWQEFAQFAIGSCTIEETRAILERGLNAVGLHVSEGSLLWDTVREFELAHLSITKPDADDFSSQLEKVVDVYRRQLSVPLLDMENTLQEWENFLQQLPDDHGINVKPVEWGYKKAHQLLESYKPFEETLMTVEDDNDKYKAYKNYITFVKDPSLAVSLYERAVSQICLNTTLWEDYCYYTMKLGDLALKVSQRALRNCPWHSTLWIARMRILEMLKKSDKELLSCFEEAIKSVSIAQILDLWLTYIEYVKRNDGEIEHLDKLCLQAKEQLANEGDPTSKILRFQANVHARKGDMTTVRKLWSEIMHNSLNKSSAYVWIEYIALEKQFGTPQNVRQLYQRAISNCNDWQQYFMDEWVMFERDIGTLDDMLKCLEKCRKNVNLKSTEYGVVTKDNYKKRNLDDQNGQFNKMKKQKIDQVRETKIEKMQPKWNNRESMDVDHSNKTDYRPADIDPEKTIFLSNFVPKMTEEVFKEIFPKAIKITIPMDRKGKSRCFAYVQFETPADAAEGLKKDREPLDGRPLFVSKCQKDRNQRQTVFKYSVTYEANKLFVKGLPKHYNKEAVEEIFKPYNATDVRLVTKFNGQPKGLAYVDFANVDDAALALKNTNQMVLGEYTITVAVSEPPNKKKESLLVQNKLNTRNSKTKLEIPLIPRSVQVKQSTSEVHNITRTNDDFRKMLLNK